MLCICECFELKCPNCQEGFLEEIETENENAGSSTTRTSHHTFPSFPPLFNMLGLSDVHPGVAVPICLQSQSYSI
ncbi:hypothetical protein EB796_000222 [Bugula neritina]|uniref:Uncharacterized protein n=1 Tax=Bugula neritina TaxID=10212 RepID=A0A7J7KTE5_BUGNE|nr:hypothetical protein EB796_000222 [Bugula neritina]